MHLIWHIVEWVYLFSWAVSGAFSLALAVQIAMKWIARRLPALREVNAQENQAPECT